MRTVSLYRAVIFSAMLLWLPGTLRTCHVLVFSHQWELSALWRANLLDVSTCLCASCGCWCLLSVCKCVSPSLWQECGSNETSAQEYILGGCD